MLTIKIVMCILEMNLNLHSTVHTLGDTTVPFTALKQPLYGNFRKIPTSLICLFKMASSSVYPRRGAGSRCHCKQHNRLASSFVCIHVVNSSGSLNGEGEVED